MSSLDTENIAIPEVHENAADACTHLGCVAIRERLELRHCPTLQDSVEILVSLGWDPFLVLAAAAVFPVPA